MKRKHYCLFLLILFLPFEISACPETDSLEYYYDKTVDSIPEDFIRKTDYLYTVWYFNRRQSDFISDEDRYGMSSAAWIPDSVYLMRIDSLNSAIRLSFNSIVRSYIEFYFSSRYRERLSEMLGLSFYYFPIFEAELDAVCLPLELKYLPVIESALNPRALSRAGASGLWQFMYQTGKMYNLQINSFIDERRDPELSTRAAVNFLNDLYGIYEDWILAIAAYNCGPGNVNKAIRRSGGKRSYWDIYYYLPRETRGYVPAYIAAVYAFNYYKSHGVRPLYPNMPEHCDSIIIQDALHFDQITSNLEISLEELRDLNPQYKSDIIPAGMGKSYSLKLPIACINDFIDRFDTIYAYKRSKFFDESLRTARPEQRFAKYSIHGTEGKTKVVYVVKKGDVPGTIASKFKVSLSDLCRWNNLGKKKIIRVGQKLHIYLPN